MSSKREELNKEKEILTDLIEQWDVSEVEEKDMISHVDSMIKQFRKVYKYLEADYKNHISIDKIEKWIEKMKKKSIPADLMKATYWYRRGFNKVLKDLKSLIAGVRGE